MLASVRPSPALEVRCSGTRFRLSTFHGLGRFKLRRARPSPFGHLGREDVLPTLRAHCGLWANESESVRGNRNHLTQLLTTSSGLEDSFRKQKEDQDPAFWGGMVSEGHRVWVCRYALG